MTDQVAGVRPVARLMREKTKAGRKSRKDDRLTRPPTVLSASKGIDYNRRMECAECRRLHLQLANYEARREGATNQIEFNRRQGNRSKVYIVKIDLTTIQMYAEMTQIEIDRHQALVHDDCSAILPQAVMCAGR